MMRSSALLVILCCSVAYANIIILSRNVDTNETILSMEDDDITGPFITVGEDGVETEINSHNTTMAASEDSDDDSPDTPDEEEEIEEEDYDDYDFTVGHLHATTQELDEATEPKPANFPNHRRKNTKKRVKRPFRRQQRPAQSLSPNRRIRRPIMTNLNGQRKRIKIRTDQRVKPAVVSQFINDINNNCKMCRCGVQGWQRKGQPRVSVDLEFPWLVHLSYFGRLYCAGALINDRYIVTAGHCTNGYVTNMITVRLLEYEQTKQTEQFGTPAVRSVEQVFRPPSYNPDTLEDDISLLKITPSVPIERITPICLPLRGSSFAGKNVMHKNFGRVPRRIEQEDKIRYNFSIESQIGSSHIIPHIGQTRLSEAIQTLTNASYFQAIVAGWGVTMLQENEPVSVLRKAIVPIFANKRCGLSAEDDDANQRMLCAGYRQAQGLNACQVLSKGDNGGPLMIKQRGKYRLAGIASHGQTCGQGSHPGIYTRMSKYNSWIGQLTQDACWCRE